MNKPTHRMHYVPNSLLANFTASGEKDSVFYVFDIKEIKQRPSSTKNAGYERHLYNFIDPNYSIDVVESELFAPLEGTFKKIISNVIQTQKIPLQSSSDYEVFSSYLTLLALRTPAVKQGILDAINRLIQNGLPSDFSEERFIERKNQFISSGIDINNYTYENFKSEVDSIRATGIQSEQQTYMISLLLSWKSQYDNFAKRKWSILTPKDTKHNFICSDNPVGCFWADGYIQDSYEPGLGTSHSVITVPIHKNMALQGSFEENSDIRSITLKEVALFNNRTFRQAERFLFSPYQNFYMRDTSGKIIDREDFKTLLKILKNRREAMLYEN